MSTSLSKPIPADADASNAARARRANSTRWPWYAGGAVVAGAAVALALFGGGGGDADAEQTPASLATVERRDLVITVNQPGQIEARSKQVIRSEVRERLTMTWIIEEGTIVDANDVLVKLDATPLQEQKLEQEQLLESAESSLVAAKVNLENTDSQTDSDIAQAELDVEFAALALSKYTEGEYPQKLRQAQANVEIARETAQRAADTAEWSQKLQGKGYITDSEARADAAAARKAELDLEIAQGELKLLKEYTYRQQLRQLTSDVQQAKAELERIKRKADADMEKANVEHKTALAKRDRIVDDLEDTQDDIDNCVIRAPQEGRVVYAPQGNRWNREEPLGEGDEVRYNQEIIHLPESDEMSVAIKIDETQRDKVEVGMPVVIAGPNLPETGLRGELTQIAEYLDPHGRWNPVKEYSATVDVLNETPGLRTGMSCQTQIIVARYEHTLVVPLVCVVMRDGQQVVYVPGRDGPTPLPVELGLDNGSVVRVIAGLREGQRVLMEPPLEPSARDRGPAFDADDDQPEADRDANQPAKRRDDEAGRPSDPRQARPERDAA